MTIGEDVMTATLARPSLADRYAAEFPGSRKLYEQARQVFPGGVTHDLRYLEPFPIYIERAQGSRKWDVDGHEFIDYWAGHGAVLLGPSPPAVVMSPQIRPRAQGWPRPVSEPSSESASAKPIEMPAPTEAASPTRKAPAKVRVSTFTSRGGEMVARSRNT